MIGLGNDRLIDASCKKASGNFDGHPPFRMEIINSKTETILGKYFLLLPILTRSIHTYRDFFLDIQALYLQYFSRKKGTSYQYLNKDCQVISWVKTILQKPGHLLMARS
jgi:hypothetical protein